MTIKRLQVGPRLSGAVVHNGLVYISGQVPDDGKADITVQTQQVLAKIDALLREAGSDKSKLLWAQIFLPDMQDFAGRNAVWETWIVAGQTPARATVEAALANASYKVEIMATAAV
jgi:enamine deaminase RidA (YjgF/YER057c/UK114 family)